jgi:hypothetical protein
MLYAVKNVDAKVAKQKERPESSWRTFSLPMISDTNAPRELKKNSKEFGYLGIGSTDSTQTPYTSSLTSILYIHKFLLPKDALGLERNVSGCTWSESRELKNRGHAGSRRLVLVFETPLGSIQRERGHARIECGGV